MGSSGGAGEPCGTLVGAEVAPGANDEGASVANGVRSGTPKSAPPGDVVAGFAGLKGSEDAMLSLIWLPPVPSPPTGDGATRGGIVKTNSSFWEPPTSPPLSRGGARRGGIVKTPSLFWLPPVTPPLTGGGVMRSG